MRLRAALILDDLSLARWQADALSEALPHLDVRLVVSCNNTHTKKRIPKNLFYYGLGFLALRNSLTKRERYKVTNERVVEFESLYEGVWQKIPVEVSDAIDAEGISVVIKFGMNLLKVDKRLEQYDILSFHHGDPSKFRGRPAGFYEVLSGEPKVGVIVQRLTNQLDSGDVLAFTEAEVVSYSYKNTSLNFYSASRFLLREALVNVKESRSLEVSTGGRNYTLPSNMMVLHFLFVLVSNFMKEKGEVFYEKK